MATLYGPGLARAEVLFTMRNVPVEITLGFATVDPPTQGGMDSLANQLHTWATDEVLPTLPELTLYRGVVVNDWTGPSGFKGEAGPPSPVPGELIGDMEPNNVTLAISFSVGRRGRAGRGRNYVPGLRKADVVDNAVVGTRITAWVNAYNALLPAGGYILTPHVWSVISTRVGGVERAFAVAFVTQEALVTDSTVDSQRGRLR